MTFQRMSTYGLPRILEVMPMRKVLREDMQILLEIVGTLATIVCAVTSLIQLWRDIRKERQQKSNRPDQG